MSLKALDTLNTSRFLLAKLLHSLELEDILRRSQLHFFLVGAHEGVGDGLGFSYLEQALRLYSLGCFPFPILRVFFFERRVPSELQLINRKTGIFLSIDQIGAPVGVVDVVLVHLVRRGVICFIFSHFYFSWSRFERLELCFGKG